MHDILRVQDLIRELESLPMEAAVMIAVVKYPDKFELVVDEEGNGSWDQSEAVEVLPLESGEVYLTPSKEAMLCVELVDYVEESGYLPGHSSHS